MYILGLCHNISFPSLLMVVLTICRFECLHNHLHHELHTVVGKLTVVHGCMICHVHDAVQVEHVEDANARD